MDEAEHTYQELSRPRSMLLLRDNFDIVRKSEQAAFTSESVGSILVAGPCEESVYSLPKVMGFSPDALVSSHTESSQGGLGQTWEFTFFAQIKS